MHRTCRTYSSGSFQKRTTRVAPIAVSPMRGTQSAPGNNASSKGSVIAALNTSTPTTLQTMKNATQDHNRMTRACYDIRGIFTKKVLWHAIRYQQEA